MRWSNAGHNEKWVPAAQNREREPAEILDCAGLQPQRKSGPAALRPSESAAALAVRCGMRLRDLRCSDGVGLDR
ncbi:hypothetical protein NDU88_004533 [Pleurodeles waltl]|uniref:Uncharacterized protein n=1 Tax=Pleurodeles waltl TaxID=8319 RepID=A0AAV7L0K9_PLEWA|nr:hypothetical protein NDU88_004533 [Pleurodeles waltl]